MTNDQENCRSHKEVLDQGYHCVKIPDISRHFHNFVQIPDITRRLASGNDVWRLEMTFENSRHFQTIPDWVRTLSVPS
jgi:hypothetical protein